MPLRPGSESLTEDEWTIRALNIHGAFFERWCQKTVANAKGWKLRSTNYPVEWPPTKGPWRGQQSTLDIRAEFQRGDQRLTLLIECKKNNPQFIDWNFFPGLLSPDTRRFTIMTLDNKPPREDVPNWRTSWRSNPMTTDYLVADEARETRGSYLQYKKDDKTKTSNAAISEAAEQIALATRSVIAEEIAFTKALCNHPSRPHPRWLQQSFVPVIVTSARLFACEFDPGDVDPTNGEISSDKVSRREQQWLVYTYPLPCHLHGEPLDLGNVLNQSDETIETFLRRDILVIYAGAFAETLDQLAGLAEEFFLPPDLS